MELVIGLEVHCQLGTASKLFCSCPASSFGASPNSSACPICTGQPGTLPVLNRKAVELAYSAAMALGCKLRPRSIFARKNYFYPDLPKGYQISQYEEPFSEHGGLDIAGPKRVRILRIHMEEDAGKLLHAVAGAELDGSLVDFNRAGVPLIEIVSEPDIRSSEEAFQYLTNLKEILQFAGVSRCDMEKGEMRCDANVSVRPRGAEKFGTRAEIKNLNSFRGVRDAIDYEFKRQCAALERGERIVQETRLWDAERRVTESLRSKEEAHDYRYFPEPDLVPLEAEEALVARVRAALPEAPSARRTRFMNDYALTEYDAGVLTAERALADYFEKAVAVCGKELAKSAANWMQSELMAKLNAEAKTVADSPVRPESLGELAALVQKGTLSGKMGKELFPKMWETGKAPAELVKELGLTQVTDSGQVGVWADEAIAENPKIVADVRAGKERAIGALVGAVMKKSKGKANPALVNDLLKEKLK
ncbi:MAG TPA: Asp-tRNA(Asn)/Glu-tRNA(Gln) amidotransferase subunit GatB [Elusimicrobiota bacterium]|nr:Asp-tRNA(Asn)/Glu-tRNA(Gln) amidotransferase subunit GatB [Elusimicrobiota bacterium]